MKILWASPFNVHDTSSGAAIEIRNMFEYFVKRGVDARVQGCFIFDHPRGASNFPNLEKDLEANKDKDFFNVTMDGVRSQYMRTKSPHVADFCDAEQRKFYARFCQILNEFKPDVVMMYGGGMTEMVMRSEARRHGVAVVYFLCNGNHGGYSFPDVDMIITDSHATAKLYAKRDSINVEVTGPFINPAKVIAAKREPKYITFINPVPAKGVTFVAKIAELAQTQLPNEKFLVVQSRGDWFQVLPALKNGETPFDPKQFPNVDVANHMSDMRPIYAASKVLLAPSLWYESYGLVATEGCMNGVPVICSTSGGLPEACGDGGIHLEMPERCRQNHALVPTAEEAQPWVDALKTMLATPESYAEWSAKATKAAERHHIDRSVDRVLELLAPFAARRAGSNPQFYRCGSATR